MIADVIRAVQRGLIAEGFNVGKSGVDGVLGKQTRAALTAYQKANGLHPSGQADAATIAALLQPASPKPNLRPPAVGQMMDSPFASRSTEAPPPQSPGGQVAGSVSPSQPGSPPPLQSGDDAMRQELQQTIVNALLRSLSVQPQPNQPAYSDQYATPSQPPAFAPPMGAYR